MTTFSQKTTNVTRSRPSFRTAIALAFAFGAISQAVAQRVTPPPTPAEITPPVGNTAYLVGHAFGSQGYTCLPTSTGGAAWNLIARPEATLFTGPAGRRLQIITHFQSADVNPNEVAPKSLPPGGNATWQSSIDSSRVWAVKSHGIDADSNIASCPNTGSIQCLLLQSIGNMKGPTGGDLLAKATFIQRLNTNGGATPSSACNVGDTKLVPYTADYLFYRAKKRQVTSGH